MPNILVVAEHFNGQLRKASRSALGAAGALAARTGGQVSGLVVGYRVGGVAEDLAAHGIPVAVVDLPALTHYLSESYAAVVAAAARAAGATWVVGAATAQGKDLLPCVAALMGGVCATDAIAFTGEGREVLVRRPMWAGNVLADVELRGEVKVVSIRATEFAAAEKAGLPGSVKALPVDVDESAIRTRFIAFAGSGGDRPDLTEARVVISGGRGTNGDFSEIEALADLLNAAIGSSRAAVDAGWAAGDLQVGQTGKVVAPEVYIAAGISGAQQHLAGMKGAKVIIAINTDPEAPIFQVADYGLVGDLFEVLPALRSLVAASQKQGT